MLGGCLDSVAAGVGFAPQIPALSGLFELSFGLAPAVDFFRPTVWKSTAGGARGFYGGFSDIEIAQRVTRKK